MKHSTLAERLAALLFARPILSVLALGIVLVASGVLLRQLRAQTIEEAFLERDTQRRAVLDAVEAQFISEDVVFVIYGGDDVLSHDALSTIRELGELIEKASIPREGKPYYVVDKVTSLANIKVPHGAGDTFGAVDLVPDPIPSRPEELAALRQRALGMSLLVDQLVSRDGRTAVLGAHLLANLDQSDTSPAAGAIREIVDDFSASRPGLTYHVYGGPVLALDVAQMQVQDAARLMPAAYGLSILFLYLFLRRLMGLLLALATITVSIVGGLAALPAVGSGMNNVSLMLPPVVVSLAVATIIHFLSELGKNDQRQLGGNAGQLTLAQLLPPVMMALLTTAVGFASLGVSRVPAIHGFGLAVGIGMLVLLVTSVSLVTLAMRRLAPGRLVSPRGWALASWLDGGLLGLGELVMRRRRLVLLCSALLLGALGVGFARLVVDQSDIAWFPQSSRVVQASKFMERRIGGSTGAVISIRTSEEGRFLRPAELRKVEQLCRFVREQLGADVVVSVNDYLKLMHREFFSGDQAYYRIPDTPEQVAQLALMLGDVTVGDYLDPTHSWLRIPLRNKLHRASELKPMFDRLGSYLAEHFPASEGYQAQATGRSALWSGLFARLIRSQVISLAVSVALIILLMCLLFRSLVTGLYSLLPNLFPLVATFGLMGWIGVELNTATVMIATVALGIAVDDTIHFLQCYRARLAEGLDCESAYRATLKTKGAGIVGTTVVISTGFLLLVASAFPPTRQFGTLAAAAMIAAVVGDLAILPAILLTTRTRLGLPAAPKADEPNGHARPGTGSREPS